MPNAALLRKQIEAALANRIPSALTPAPRTIREVFSTGIAEVDAMTGGGLPVGAITEVIGQECSGRTSLALSFLAQITSDERVCAWVDTNDALDPESASANGIQLSRLLWVRCNDGASRSRQGFEAVETGSVATVQERAIHQHTVCGGSHPRSEVRGMDRFVKELFETPLTHVLHRNPRTEAVANLRLKSVPGREQTSSNRDQTRRNEFLAAQHESLIPRCSETIRKTRPNKAESQTLISPTKAKKSFTNKPSHPWACLDQAIKATDLLMQAGGFSAIVIDLCGIAHEHATRIPLATWFRFRAAAEHSRTCLLILTQHAYAHSCASLSLSLSIEEVMGKTVIEEVTYCATCERERHVISSIEMAGKRRPPTSTWSERMYWAGRR